MITIHFDRSEAVAESTGLPACRVSVPYSTRDGEWMQLTYDTICSQDGTFLFEYDADHNVWIGPNDEPFSDIVVSFNEMSVA